MKRALLLVLILITCAPVCFAIEDDMKLPNVFIWSVPDEVRQPVSDNLEEEGDAPENAYIEEKQVNNDAQENKNEEVGLELDTPEDVDLGTVSATTLKGYAEFVEDAESIYLKDSKNQFVVNLKVPQKIQSTQSLKLKQKMDIAIEKQISKYNNEEYKISSDYSKAVVKVGDFSFGTVTGYDVDTSMLEYETGLFTRYEKKKFALATTYKKSLNTTYGQYVDTFSLTPEFRLNKIFAIKEVLSADMTRNKRSGELVLKITPYGYKDNDRLNFEVGAKQTMDAANSITRTQFKFSTEFKL